MSDFYAIWWIWLCGALVLAILEILAPGFVLLGFAIGALAVSMMLLSDLWPGLSLPVLLLIFSALSLAAWLILRRAFTRPGAGPKHFDHDINDH